MALTRWGPATSMSATSAPTGSSRTCTSGASRRAPRRSCTRPPRSSCGRRGTRSRVGAGGEAWRWRPGSRVHATSARCWPRRQPSHTCTGGARRRARRHRSSATAASWSRPGSWPRPGAPPRRCPRRSWSPPRRWCSSRPGCASMMRRGSPGAACVRRCANSSASRRLWAVSASAWAALCACHLGSTTLRRTWRGCGTVCWPFWSSSR
mmetsp:Transcript_75033/g.237241  ORF Transcript_75033/g.237241 Transcript_75033/m.237241 type:complete len:208 (-) Transcript_75033:115-738(-)